MLSAVVNNHKTIQSTPTTTLRICVNPHSSAINQQPWGAMTDWRVTHSFNNEKYRAFKLSGSFSNSSQTSNKPYQPQKCSMWVHAHVQRDQSVCHVERWNHSGLTSSHSAVFPCGWWGSKHTNNQRHTHTFSFPRWPLVLVCFLWTQQHYQSGKSVTLGAFLFKCICVCERATWLWWQLYFHNPPEIR